MATSPSSSAVKFHVLGATCFLSTTSSVKSKYVFFRQTLNSKFLNLSKKSSNTTRRNCGPVIVQGKVVGIDLGTTNSAVAAMVNGKPKVITSMPSVVAYTQNGDLLVGETAKTQASENPENTFFSVKRFIGRDISEVDEESKEVCYQVVGGDDEYGNVKLVCPAIGKHLAAENISAQIMRKLVDDASTYLNEKVTKAVVTVPSYFNDVQRRAIMDAGRMAGLEILRIIHEPYAASLAHEFEDNKGMILVFDLGGGTFDVSVFEVGCDMDDVLSVFGDTHLGGDDFDKRIVDWLAESFKRDEGTDLLKDRQALQCLAEAAEKAKIELSFSTQASISLSFITESVDGPKRIETTLTRVKFEELCSDLLDRLKVAVENSLRDGRLAFNNVDEVILVGGSTRIPAVQELVKKLTGKNPNVTVNHDDKVALGAAIQAGFFSGDVSKWEVDRYGDRLALPLGLETSGGMMVRIIGKYRGLPDSVSQTFSTIADGQASIVMHVLQGESEFVGDNKSLGHFRIDGICPAPRGVPQIEVNFNIDKDGIVSVEAFDKSTGKKMDITITHGTRLPGDTSNAPLMPTAISYPLKASIKDTPKPVTAEQKKMKRTKTEEDSLELDRLFEEKISIFNQFMSNYGRMRSLMLVQIKWLIKISQIPQVTIVPSFSDKALSVLQEVVDKFDASEHKYRFLTRYARCNTTDVHAVGAYLYGDCEPKRAARFSHHACTHEDLIKLSYAFSLKEAINKVMLPVMDDLIRALCKMAKDNADVPMLCRTDIEPDELAATTVGKEIATFAARLSNERHRLSKVAILGDFAGYSGNYNANVVAYPELNWQQIAKEFVEESLGLAFNPYVRVEPHDYMVDLVYAIKRFSTILREFFEDVQTYTSLGFFNQISEADEFMSLTTPQEMNLLDEITKFREGRCLVFKEEIEEKTKDGAFGWSSSTLAEYPEEMFATRIIKELGDGLMSQLLSYKVALLGIGKLQVNKACLRKDLDVMWESAMLLEPARIVMERYGLELWRYGVEGGYTESSIKEFILELEIPEEAKANLLKLTPQNYIGHAANVADCIDKIVHDLGNTV